MHSCRSQSSRTEDWASLQAVFRSDLSHLLELLGSGKESLIFMKKRIRRLTAQWALAAQRLARKLEGIQRDQKQVPDPLCVRGAELRGRGEGAQGSSGHRAALQSVL